MLNVEYRLGHAVVALALILLIGWLELSTAAANDSWGRRACISAIGDDQDERRSMLIVGSHQVLGLHDTIKSLIQNQAVANKAEADQADIVYLTPFSLDSKISLPNPPIANHVLLQSYDYFQGLDLKTNDDELRLHEMVRESVCGRVLMRGASETLESMFISFYADEQSVERRRTTRLIVVSLLQAIEPAFGQDQDGTFAKMAYGMNIRAELAALLHSLRTKHVTGNGR
jgi:hypothetical protein